MADWTPELEAELRRRCHPGGGRSGTGAPSRQDLAAALDELARLREERDGLRARILGLAKEYEERARRLYARPEIAYTAARASDAEDVADAIRRCL